MLTYKFTLKNTINKTGKQSIILQLIKDRKNTSISLGQECLYEDWSYSTDRVKKSDKKHKLLNAFIEKLELKIEAIISELELNDIQYSIKDVVKLIKEDDKPLKSYSDFHQSIIDDLISIGKLNTADIERYTLKSLLKFNGNKEISFRDMDVDFLMRYETYLRECNNNDTGIAIKMRTIRAVYNKGIKRGFVSSSLYPFKDYKISRLKRENKKQYLTKEEINLLYQFTINNNKLMFARDMFLFSYYCRGINFVDIMELKKISFNNGRLSYNRSKTGAYIEFKVHPLAIDIVEKYMVESATDFLFPIIIQESPTEKYILNKKRKRLKEINSALSEIMSLLHINKHITFYCARHSFATALKFKNISIDIIGDALGHGDINSTISYLNKLPSPMLDGIIDKLI